jgi:hypothetical protein
VEQLSALDIYLNPASKADVLLAINTLPAATTADETANVRLRGTPAAANTVYFNRVPVYDPVRLDQLNGLGQFSIFNTSLLQGVAVYPSNAPLGLGGSTGGAVALRTRKRLDGGTNMLNLSLAGLGGQWAIDVGEHTQALVAANFGHDAWLKAVNPLALANIGHFRTHDAALYLTHELSDYSSLQLFSLAMQEDYSYRVRSANWADWFEQQKTRSLTILNYHWQRGAWRWEWNQGFNYSRANYDWANIAVQDRRYDYHSNCWINRATETVNYSLGLHFDWRQQQQGGRFPAVAGAIGEGYPTAAYHRLGQLQRLSVYTYRRQNLGPRWKLGMGGQWQPLRPVREGSPWAAQVNLLHEAESGHQWIVGAGRYLHYDWAAAESGRSIERQLGSQLSLDWQYHTGPWHWQAALYGNRLGLGRQHYRILGIEGQCRYEGRRGAWWFSVSRVRSELTSADGPSPYDFPFWLRAGGRWQLPGQWTVAWSGQWRSGQAYSPLIDREWQSELEVFLPVFAPVSSSERLPAYYRMDFSVSKMFILGNGVLIAYLNANNITDHDNIHSYHYDQDLQQASPNYFERRSLFVGATWQW